ncbi:PilZ domain protein [compost metagenome]
MTSLARYHARSPRYILNTQDDSLIRVAGPHQTPWEEGTEIRNVSLTGLAFLAPQDLCPLLGEVIKIQFIPPGGKQMACHAIVTRLDEIGENILVGVHFYKLEMAHRIALAQGLARRLKEQQDRGELDNLLNKAPSGKFSLSSLPHFVIMMLLGMSWMGAIFALMKFEYVGLFTILQKLFI